MIIFPFTFTDIIYSRLVGHLETPMTGTFHCGTELI